MKTIEYLDKCKEKLLMSSTYELAHYMDVSEQLLSNYYRGRNEADDYMCFKMAEILEFDPAYVIASIKAESEKNEKKASYFRSFSGASRKIAASTVLAVLLSFTFLTDLGTQSDFNALWRVFLKRRRFV